MCRERVWGLWVCVGRGCGVMDMCRETVWSYGYVYREGVELWVCVGYGVVGRGMELLVGGMELLVGGMELLVGVWSCW